MLELGSNAVVTGLLLGGIYAVASLGLTVAFGLLQVPNVAHPTFVVLGAYCAYFGNVIGIDPDFRGRGWGRALTEAGLDWLARRGLTVGMLYVDADNTAALSLYRSMGFVEDHVDRAYIGHFD